MTSTSRIAKNTGLLYIRMIFILVVNLYTSRIVLNVLGVTDYGIYNVIGGVVTMFSIISSSMTSAISRFITFELGKGDENRIKVVFSTALIIQFFIALIIILLVEVLAVWFLNYKMQIPSDRLNASHWVLHFSLFVFVVNLISVPYNACIVAHEKMKAFAYISVFEATIRLLIVFVLLFLPFDKLISYSVLFFISSLFTFSLYRLYCTKHFPECHVQLIYEKQLLREMAGFAGWSFIGNSAGILRNQGVNILLNLYFGPVVNAANGIATQVNSALSGFYSNFMMAVNPQIIKNYSQSNLDESYRLVLNSARWAFMLMFLITTPIMIGTPLILKIWLNIVPEYTITLVRLILLLTLVECVCIPLITLNQATGDIRNYQIVVGTIHLMNFPISWFFLKIGFTPSIVYIIAILLAIINLYARLYMLKRSIGISIRSFMGEVLSRIIYVLVLTTIPLLVVKTNLNQYWAIIVSFVMCVFVVCYIGITKNERLYLRKKILKK